MLRLELEERERKADGAAPLANLGPTVERHVRVLHTLEGERADVNGRTKIIASSPVISSARLSESEG